MARKSIKKYELLADRALELSGYIKNSVNTRNDHCIFCDKKKLYAYTEKVKPLNQCGKYSDIHTICFDCYKTTYKQLKEKFKELF